MRIHVRLGIVMPLLTTCVLIASAASAHFECRREVAVGNLERWDTVTLAAVCKDSEVVTGGGCSTASLASYGPLVIRFRPSPELDRYLCDFASPTTVTLAAETFAVCCKVRPDRELPQAPGV